MRVKATKLALCAALALVLSGSGRPEHPANPHLTVIYVGADDCGPCRVWHRDYLPKFTDTASARLTYVEIVAPKLHDLLDDAYWPKAMRQYRDRLDRGAGVPLWFVVANNNIVLRAQGLHAWSDSALPLIRSLVR